MTGGSRAARLRRADVSAIAARPHPATMVGEAIAVTAWTSAAWFGTVFMAVRCVGWAKSKQPRWGPAATQASAWSAVAVWSTLHSGP